jgi:hypothetical protein
LDEAGKVEPAFVFAVELRTEDVSMRMERRATDDEQARKWRR